MPGPNPGLECSLIQCLQRDASMCGNQCPRVRVSIDGARICNKSNFIVMSYAVWDAHNILDASGNKVVGLVNAAGCCKTQEESFSVLEEVNAIAKLAML